MEDTICWPNVGSLLVHIGPTSRVCWRSTIQQVRSACVGYYGMISWGHRQEITGATFHCSIIFPVIVIIYYIPNRRLTTVSSLKQGSATDWPRTKSWDISLDCHNGKFWGVIRSKIVFFISNISVPCPHAQLKGRTVIKKLWTFFGPWGRDRSRSPPCWIFRV